MLVRIDAEHLERSGHEWLAEWRRQRRYRQRGRRKLGRARPRATSPLVGTCDIVYAVGATSGTATLTLSATSFALTAAGTDITADVSGAVPEISGKLGIESGPVATTHVKSPVDFGQVPIDIGGTWNFHGAKTGTCRADVSAELLSLDCVNLAPPLSHILAEYDYTTKKTTGTGLSNAQRTSKAESIFGELGGTWRAVAPRAVCDVTFEGAQMKASCTKNDTTIEVLEDVFTLTFDGAVVSGTSEAGGELSARKR